MLSRIWRPNYFTYTDTDWDHSQYIRPQSLRQGGFHGAAKGKHRGRILGSFIGSYIAHHSDQPFVGDRNERNCNVNHYLGNKESEVQWLEQGTFSVTIGNREMDFLQMIKEPMHEGNGEGEGEQEAQALRCIIFKLPG